MKKRDTLLFVGKCLTLGQYPERIGEVQKKIVSGLVNWEQVVLLSTNHFVFPALYLQLKRAGLLSLLPPDLVNYMEDITTLNRNRNQMIIAQAWVISEQLNRFGISPVFLKGTAHLLDDLYEDIGERMVGDIDFLVEETEMVKAAEILISNGYQPMSVYNPKDLKQTKHYPRMGHDHFIAAVEIHRELLISPFCNAISGEVAVQNSQRLTFLNEARILCNKHQIIHNILNVQVNDNGYYYGAIFLRQEYDLLLLARRENPLIAVKEFGRYFHRMNANLALTNQIFGNPKSIPYEPEWQVNLFLWRVWRNFTCYLWERISHPILYLLLRFTNYAKLLILIIHNKDARSSLFTRLRDPKWYGAHIRSYKAMM